LNFVVVVEFVNLGGYPKKKVLWLITHSHRLLLPVLFLGYLMWYLSCVRWVAHMIVKTVGSACLLLEIRWLKGRQASNVHMQDIV
jgi:hypothetical protein